MWRHLSVERSAHMQLFKNGNLLICHWAAIVTVALVTATVNTVLLRDTDILLEQFAFLAQ